MIVTGILYIFGTAYAVAEDKVPVQTSKQEYVMIVPLTKIKPLEANSWTIRAYIKKVFGEQSDNAIKVFTCESGLNPKAINYNDGMEGYNAFGIAQIHNKFWKEDKYNWKSNWQDNILMAKYIYDIYGWKPWTCSKITGVI